MTTDALLALSRRKVRTAEELSAEFGPRPRARTIAMCHGVFDVAHPGHVRHLLHAKAHADLLVASLTADIHVDKGADRPHVPQDLRAASLAALEIVDFVLVDPHPTPLHTLRTLKPDVFAKGFEYNAKTLNPKSAEEMAIVEAYGGRMLFSPGDVVYSSSALIELAPPPIAVEKALAAMDRAGLDFEGLRRLARSGDALSATVMGDLILERRVRCAALGRATADAPRRARQLGAETRLAGAVDVAAALSTAGVRTELLAPLGEDEGFDAARGLDLDVAIAVEIETTTRPTPKRTLIELDGRRELIVEASAAKAVDDLAAAALAARVDGGESDIVLYADHGAGALHRKTRGALLDAAPARATRAAETAGGAFGVDLLLMAEADARATSFDGADAPLQRLAAEMLSRTGAAAAMIDRSQGGAASAGPEALGPATVLDPLRTVAPNRAAARAYAAIAKRSHGSDAAVALLAAVASAAGARATPGAVVAVIDKLAKEAGDG